MRAWHPAWFDPATGKLTAPHSGSVVLSVTVNGVQAQATVTLGRAAAEQVAA